MEKPSIPKITLVTVSGAHATGKTTLISDLREELSQDPNVHVEVVPSCSSWLFEQLRSGKVQALSRGTPQSYDDIDSMGYRDVFQRTLPDALASLVEIARTKILADRPLPSHVYLMVDRWWPDILAYTHIEVKSPTVRGEVEERCRMLKNLMVSELLEATDRLRAVHLFVPVSASPFAAVNEKFRATCGREEFEAMALRLWRPACGDRAHFYRVTNSDREQRKTEVLSRIRPGKPSPQPKT